MRNLFLFVLLVYYCESNAQAIRPFIGGSAYLQWDFEKSSFAGVNAGAEFKIKPYFVPELECSYFFGSIEDASKYKFGAPLVQTELYIRSVSSLNFSFCPKIAIGNKNDGASYLVILPRYTFSKIEAKGDFVEYNENGTYINHNEFEKSTQQSLGLGVGLDIPLSDDNSNSIGFILYYNGINLGKAINSLQHSTGYEFNSNGVLGLGVNYYFSLRKSSKPVKYKIPQPL
ncbi:MAG: hypothetical protein K2X95_10505 [Flavobacteriaceae bacterium]|nr:hypothetical protein [Flavobacteriaceae bacterium]